MVHFYLHRFSQLNDSCFLKESDWLVYRIDWTFGIILYLWNKTNRLIVRIHANKSAPFSRWLNITAEVALGPKVLEVPSPQTHVPLRWKIVTWPTSDETTVVTYTVHTPWTRLCWSTGFRELPLGIFSTLFWIIRQFVLNYAALFPGGESLDGINSTFWRPWQYPR